jgi:cytochrome b6-f complex iron-sulfur subunit
MSEPVTGAAAPAAPPTPRPPGSVVPRRPRAPDQRGEELQPESTPVQIRRRTLAWLGLTGFFTIIAGCTVKFFFPRTLTEPKTSFKIGRKDDYAFGVDDRLQQQYRIWVCRDTSRLYVILAICTHLGCTPNWVSSANKFKCPCHGSGYDSAGVNFEGPAPRPMARCHVEIAPDGQIIVDKLKTYEEKDWNEPGAFLLLA